MSVLNLDNPMCEVRMLEQDMWAQGHQRAELSPLKSIEDLKFGPPLVIISDLIHNILKMKLMNFIFNIPEDYTSLHMLEIESDLKRFFNAKFDKEKLELEITWKVTEVDPQ